MQFRLFSLLFVAVAILSVGCNDDNKQSSPCDIDFDQTAMLENMATNIIIPIYTTLNEDINSLADQRASFAANPSVENLQNLRNQFTQAYLTWSSAAIYEFGPAESVFLRQSINNFPLDTDQLLANISAGSYDFNMPDSYDKGFPALDYLLYASADTDAAIVDKLQELSTSQYLTDVVADMQTRINQTYTSWTDGGYKVTFVNKTGVEAGKSVSLIVNNLNHYYELIKRDKIGIPSGAITLGFAYPDKVEAIHSELSLQLMTKAIEACEQLYKGANGQGLDDYLIAADAQKGVEPLNDLILERFELAKTSVAALPEPLSQAIEDNATTAQNTYNDVVKQLVTLKTDMPFALCVSITYVDNPSDSD